MINLHEEKKKRERNDMWMFVGISLLELFVALLKHNYMKRR